MTLSLRMVRSTRRTLPVLLALAALAAAEPAKPPAADAYRLSGPFTHENLTVFLVHGPDLLASKTLLTLDEALEQKKAIVHETKNVNELAIENVSDTEEVFVQSGDIVKGGQQDRVLAFDLIVPPKSGKVPLASFCVEAGRWSGRPGEAAGRFACSKDCFNSNELKLAARGQGSQREVWDKVAKSQGMLEKNVGAPVKDAKSESSLQLTLEHKKVVEAVEAYVKEIAPCPRTTLDAIGCVVAINGKVYCADVYASSTLFRKLWPKLLKAGAVEAVAQLQKGKQCDAVTADAVRAFLADGAKGKRSEKEVSKRFCQVRQETENNVLFESRDRDRKDLVLRRSYLAK